MNMSEVKNTQRRKEEITLRVDITHSLAVAIFLIPFFSFASFVYYNLVYVLYDLTFLVNADNCSQCFKCKIGKYVFNGDKINVSIYSVWK